MSVVPRGDLQEGRGAAESGSADPRVGSQEAGGSSSGDVSIGRVISAGSSSSGIDAREVGGCSRLLGCGDDLGVEAEEAARSGYHEPDATCCLPRPGAMLCWIRALRGK